MGKIIKVSGTRVQIAEDAGVKQVSKLVVPDSVNMNELTGLQDHIRTGTVVGFGGECKFVKQGMRVLYGRGDVAHISLSESEKYAVLREKTILFSFTDNIDQVNNDRVIIGPEPKDKTTAGGLIIPDSVAHRPSMGKVAYVGNECTWAKVGMRVLFGNAAGTPVTFKGKDWMVLREVDVIGEWHE